MARRIFLVSTFVVLGIVFLISAVWPPVLWSLVIFGPLIALGIRDMLQSRQTIRRNFPVIGNVRYLLELIRPEIYQYFIESNASGVPFSREERSVVYQRAKDVLDTLPFGTQKNVYEVGYEWVNHSTCPKHIGSQDMRVRIGGPDCKQPYSASLLNISAMSYGALSKSAVLALAVAYRTKPGH